MSAFGEELRAIRLEAGLRQVDVCERLGGAVARSTLANIESGREPPSARVLALFAEHLPQWFERLKDLPRERSPRPVLTTTSESVKPVVDEALWRPGGAFDLESLSLCYVFQHSRSPSEIIEVRRVRARRNGAARYGLRLIKTGEGAFSVDSETLWGGNAQAVETTTVSGGKVVLHEVVFDRLLARGQRHEFATRTWIERDDDPGTAIILDLTIPTREISVHLCFLGPVRPKGYTVYGPLADESQVPEQPGSAPRTPMSDSGRVAAYFPDPQIGPVYGIAWEW